VWIPLFEVASQDLDSDAPLLRGILDRIQQISLYEGNGYRLDSEAQFAMGWWFYTIHVREEFVRRAVEHLHAQDSKAKDERALLELVQKEMKRHQSRANIKMHGQKSFFAGYWAWLMR